MRYQRKAYSRAEREAMVINAFAIHIQNGKPNQLTMYQIARKLGMTPSDHIMKILKKMAIDGKLKIDVVKRKGRYDTLMFRLPDGLYTEPKKSREITVKSKGKLVGQLELFS